MVRGSYFILPPSAFIPLPFAYNPILPIDGIAMISGKLHDHLPAPSNQNKKMMPNAVRFLPFLIPILDQKTYLEKGKGCKKRIDVVRQPFLALAKGMCIV